MDCEVLRVGFNFRIVIDGLQFFNQKKARRPSSFFIFFSSLFRFLCFI